MAWTSPTTRATGFLVTAAVYNADIINNLKLLWRELSRTEITADVTISATSAAAADTVVSSGAVVYEAKPIRITFFSPAVRTGTGAGADVFVNLWDDSTDLGRLALVGNADGTNPAVAPVMAQRKLTPTAASHTYQVKAWREVANGTVHATSTYLPSYLLIEAAES